MKFTASNSLAVFGLFFSLGFAADCGLYPEASIIPVHARSDASTAFPFERLNVNDTVRITYLFGLVPRILGVS